MVGILGGAPTVVGILHAAAVDIHAPTVVGVLHALPPNGGALPPPTVAKRYPQTGKTR